MANAKLAFSVNLKNIMTNNELSERDVYHLFYIDDKELQDVLSGKRTVSVNTAARVASFMGRSVYDLFHVDIFAN